MNPYVAQLANTIPTALRGSVARTQGAAVAVAGFPAPIGALASIVRHGADDLLGEVIGFRDDLTLLAPLGDTAGVRRGSHVRLVRSSRTVQVGDALLGRVLDATGKVIDGGRQPVLTRRVLLEGSGQTALERPRIDTPLATGIRAIDGLLTCGLGQRLGIFAGSGVGKSVTMGMMARNSSADVCVVALIGERSREVNEFLQNDLGEEGRRKSVVVVATSDQPPLVRIRAALAATSMAEHFRDQGKNVLLMMDSLTRFAMAQREIGLAAGEPPATRGYTPSMFAALPRLVERAGRTEQGSITAFYTVLVEGDDFNEPVSDTVRGLLDGHILLSRDLAARGHYPAIDVLPSISRLMTTVADNDHQQAATAIRRCMADYRDHEDLISIGAYRPGNDHKVDVAMRMNEPIEKFLKQQMFERGTLEQSRDALLALARQAETLPPIAKAAPQNTTAAT